MKIWKEYSWLWVNFGNFCVFSLWLLFLQKAWFLSCITEQYSDRSYLTICRVPTLRSFLFFDNRTMQCPYLSLLPSDLQLSSEMTRLCAIPATLGAIENSCRLITGILLEFSLLISIFTAHIVFRGLCSNA